MLLHSENIKQRLSVVEVIASVSSYSQKNISTSLFFRYHRICHFLCESYIYSYRYTLLVNGNEQISNFALSRTIYKESQKQTFPLIMAVVTCSYLRKRLLDFPKRY